MMKTAQLLVCGLILLSASGSLAQTHIIIGWNDLGMHCSNKDFSTLVVLPPYNNVIAQVIRVGDSTQPPVVVTTDLRVTYEIPGNTYSVGKTNFWDYEDQIFGVSLPPNVGLTGEGMTGEMHAAGNYFVVDGVPVTPFVDSDLLNEDPFQLGLLSLYDSSDHLLATAPPVVPVSNEINCVSSGCHSSEQGILNQHDTEGGFDPGATPILCASCHSSNALGTPGSPGVPSLSEAIHKKHGEHTDDCYKCHPGPNTQCYRDVMQNEHGFVCQTCHGSVTQVGESISSGREPWLEEPSCASAGCHASNYAEEPGKLFRQSQGHGGLFCSACHGEPHAIVPSREARDNAQNVALQGYEGTLNNCITCHGLVPDGPGPHGITNPDCLIVLEGDADESGSVSAADIILLVGYVFKGGVPPEPCIANGDVNCSGEVNSADIIYLVGFVFKGGVPPCDICQESPMVCQ